MSYHLDPKKEEEVKTLLRTDSVREIVAKTGVAYNTIRRIRDENLTGEERVRLKKQANVKGANRRELKKREDQEDLQKDGQNIPKNIPSKLLSNTFDNLRSTNSSEKGGQEIMTEEAKTCTNPKCPKTNPQPIGEFNKNTARPSGRESRCRTCTAQAQRDWKTAREKETKGGTGRIRKNPRNGRRRQPRDLGSTQSSSSRAIPPEAITLDVQLLRAVKRSAVIDFVKNDLPGIVEKAFA